MPVDIVESFFDMQERCFLHLMSSSDFSVSSESPEEEECSLCT